LKILLSSLSQEAKAAGEGCAARPDHPVSVKPAEENPSGPHQGDLASAAGQSASESLACDYAPGLNKGTKNGSIKAKGTATKNPPTATPSKRLHEREEGRQEGFNKKVINKR